MQVMLRWSDLHALLPILELLQLQPEQTSVKALTSENVIRKIGMELPLSHIDQLMQ